MTPPGAENAAPAVVHRYYACSTCARAGKSAGKGRSIRMDELDGLVTEHLVKRLLDPQRLGAMLATLASRRAAKAATVDERITILDKEVHDCDERLRHLYKLVEDGAAEPDDILQDRLTALEADRDRAQAALVRAKAGIRPSVDINPALIERFGQIMRERLTTGEISFRKTYIGAIVDWIVVDDRHIRIMGRKDVLEAAVAAKGGPIPGVRSFLRNWRARQDSNL